MTPSQGTTNAQTYHGAEWIRVDLHLHSPGSYTLTLPDGVDPARDRDQVITLFVQQLVEAGIEIAAITDYQTVHSEWYLPIRDQALERGIVVFPGSELSFCSGKRGLHLLAVFPSSAALDEIKYSIQALHRRPSETLASSRTVHIDIDGNPESCRSKLCDGESAVLIAAHPNGDKGLLTAFDPRMAAQHAKSIRLDALEDLDDRDRARLVSTGILAQHPCRQLASVSFSDPKDISDIGTKARPDGTPRATYLKLSVRDSLEAIRLALHDPDVMVRVGHRPSHDYTRFLGLTIEGNGFLGGLTLAFSPELNVLVGGRGVGKSALLETIRYVLDLSSYSTSEYRENLVRHALGSGGKATLWLEQVIGRNVHRCFRLERAFGEVPRVFELDPERGLELPPLDVLGDRHKPLFFGQREIYEITNNKQQMLRLLDELIGKSAADKVAEVTRLEESLCENARRILDIQQRLCDRDEIEHRLLQIDHDIDVYERQGVAQKLREATALAADQQLLLRAISLLPVAKDKVQELGDDLQRQLESTRKELAAGRSSQSAVLAEAGVVIECLSNSLDQALEAAEEASTAAETQMAVLWKRWLEARRPTDEAIQQVKQALGEQSLSPDRLIELVEEKAKIEPSLRDLETLQTEETRLREERQRLIGELSNARQEVWRLRSQEAARLTRLLRGRVQLEVTYGGQRSEYADRLAGFCHGSNLDKPSYQRLAEAAQDGYALAEVVRKGCSAIEETCCLSPARARQLYLYLTQSEARLLDLELIAPEDRVDVSLSLDGRAVPLEKLSAGQRATAMLLLLLAQDDRPLIVDQPEDDLDNRFIYDDIVQILRRQKGLRQIIVATHNPNIPVLGNAELLVALQTHDGRAAVEVEAGIDAPAAREVIKRVMEGGEDAFRRRAAKYGVALADLQA